LSPENRINLRFLILFAVERRKRGGCLAKKLILEISSVELASLLGITQERVRQLREKNLIPYSKKGNRYKYILEEAVQAYCSMLREKAAGRSLNASEEELKKEKLQAEIILKRSQGELHMLKTAIENGEYLPIEQITNDYNNFFSEFRSFVRSLPQVITSEIGSELSEHKKRLIQKKILDRIDERLEEFVLDIEPKKKAGGRPRKLKHDG